MKAHMRWMLPMLCAGALAATVLPEAQLHAQGPTVVLVNPSQDNEQVRTLRNSELSPVLGSLKSPNGVNRVTVYIKRLSDGNYWNGLGWVAVSTAITSTVTAKSPSPPFFDFRMDSGPNAAAITAGTQYLIQIYAYDLTGALTTKVLYFTGID